MRLARVQPRDGDQLRLDLFREVPWDGRSPRGLTRVQIGLFFKRELPEAVRFHADPAQYDLWPVERRVQRKEPRAASPGASLLLEPRRLEEV